MAASNGRNGQSGVARDLLLRVLRGQITRADAARQAGVPETAIDAARDALLAAKLPPASLTLRGHVQQPVRIVRDKTGTAHVYAETARDLFVGYGFALAQDRLWQIDYYRRRALGRLAEVLGPDAVALGPPQPAARVRQHRRPGDRRALTSEEAEALDGFAAGINAWIDQAAEHPALLPIEFEILEYTPERWSPRDSIALMRAFFWQLTGRLENLAAGEAASRYLGADLGADFLTTEAADETILPSASTGRGRLVGAGAGGGADTAGGSNNWAVAPSRSASGSAMLASDPHLPYMLPVGLYQIHLSGAGYDVAGSGYPARPASGSATTTASPGASPTSSASPRDLYVETLDADR